MPHQTRTCQSCGRSIAGRSDKKFCDDQCRNDNNNKLNYSNNYMRNVNNALRRNRRVLEELITHNNNKDKVIVPKDKLIDQGFRFKYLTHIYTNKKGMAYYFCYDHGYLPLENDWYLIVKNKEE